LQSNEAIAHELVTLGEQLVRSTVSVRVGRGGAGSGVIWPASWFQAQASRGDADGLIVTNAHVARGGRAEIELWDGRTLGAEVTAIDDSWDLASLTVEAVDLPAAEIGDSDELRPGQLVLAMGNPLGLRNALTIGLIHAMPERAGQRWVQADIRLAPGNSGGPLADAAGQVIGINSMISGGLGLAVPSNAVRRFLRAARPRLGISLRPVPLLAANSTIAGLLILEVAAGSAAQRAGLGIGDVIVAVAGRSSSDPRELLDALAWDGPILPLEITRGGVRFTLDVALEPNEERSAGPANRSQTAAA
jgi:serine protease Do